MRFSQNWFLVGIVILFVLSSLFVFSVWPSRAANTQIVIHAKTIEGRLAPELFGEFSEIIRGSMELVLGAEKIVNRGFERPDTNADHVSDPWVPVVLDNGDATFAIDPAESIKHFADYPSHSQRIVVTKEGTVGIVQAEIAIRKDETIDLSLWLKQKGAIQGVTVVFIESKTRHVYWQHTFDEIDRDWHKFACQLTVPKSDPKAAFAILVKGTGSLWVDQVSAMPQDNVHGFRREARDAFRELAPATIRIPGGNFTQHYHWTDGVGPRDMRPAVPNYSWDDYMEPNNIGIDEMLRFWKEAVGAEPIMCINIGDTGGKRPKPNNSTKRALADAVNLLEYCNGPVDTSWGARRAANGHPTPYNVRIWEIGNEIGYGHITGQLDAETYARRVIQFVKALKKKDPNIKIIASGLPRSNWNQILLKRAGNYFDYLAIHAYWGSANIQDMAAQPLRFEQVLQRLGTSIRKNTPPGRTIKIAFNEWAPAGFPSRRGTIDDVIYTIGILHAFMRQYEVVAMEAVTDAWTHVRFHGNQSWTLPVCEAMKLIYRYHGQELLDTEVDCDTFDSPTQGRNIPLLDVVATRSEKTLYVSVLNKGPKTLSARIVVTGVRVGAGRSHVLAAPTLTAKNTPETPRAIVVQSGTPTPASSAFKRSFVGYSGTVLEIPLK